MTIPASNYQMTTPMMKLRLAQVQVTMTGVDANNK